MVQGSRGPLQGELGRGQENGSQGDGPEAKGNAAHVHEVVVGGQQLPALGAAEPQAGAAHRRTCSTRCRGEEGGVDLISCVA